jgi:hypothetical protein
VDCLEGGWHFWVRFGMGWDGGDCFFMGLRVLGLLIGCLWGED